MSGNFTEHYADSHNSMYNSEVQRNDIRSLKAQ